jgi:hypothetical protein
MGSGSSTQNSRGSSSKAEQGKQLADEVLTLLLGNASFTKLLSLHNLDACPRFIFSTAKELETKFQKLKIYPERGADGEILFSAVSELSPGLDVTGNKNTVKDLDKIKRRNELCIDIAYFYIRAFQVYMALAMTTLNATPTRLAGRSSSPIRGPSSAPMVGGALVLGKRAGARRPTAADLLDTPLEPLSEYFTVSSGRSQVVDNYIITLDSTSTGKTTDSAFSILWNPSYTQPQYKQSITVKAKYAGSTYEGGRGIEIDVKFNRKDNKVTMEIDGKNIITFIKPSVFFPGSRTWVFEENGEQYESADDIRSELDLYFNDNINSYKKKNNTKKVNRPSSASFSSSSTSATSVGRGQTSFEGFDSLKKIFESYKDNKKEFPKAYCVARAMALLNPCFPSEKVKGIQYESQICRSTFDFEPAGEKHLPREASEPKRNIYLQSLISLYYDSYIVKDGKAVLSQTEDDRTNLRKASALLADLYLIESFKEEFIGDTDPGASVTQHRFKSFEVCQKKEVYIGFNETDGAALVSKLQSECINPMIRFQEEHTLKVNNLLNKMFEIKRAGAASEIKFSQALKGFGIEGVNKFAREARTLLLEYYLKSEAYYVRGVRFIAETPKAWNSNPTAAVKK